jgi:hypothetical protein
LAVADASPAHSKLTGPPPLPSRVKKAAGFALPQSSIAYIMPKWPYHHHKLSSVSLGHRENKTTITYLNWLNLASFGLDRQHNLHDS